MFYIENFWSRICTCTVESLVQDDEEEGLIIKWKCVADGNQILVRNIFCDRCFRLYKCENDPLSRDIRISLCKSM